MRPLLHFTPRAGWMNDPNGLVQLGGRHHLFYQANPHGTRFASMCWGHAVSTDLLRWEQLPTALTPGQPYDQFGCWSGVTVDVDGRRGLLYTGVAQGGELQLPCLAWAADDDLIAFVKDPANPLMAARPFPDEEIVAFRDHCVTRDGRWRQLIGGGTRTHGGVLFIYRSDDFRHWSYSGLLSDSGRTPIPGPIWECPDVFTMDRRSAMIVSVLDAPSHVSYWAVGEDAGDEFRSEATGLLDVGDHFYAPQSYLTDDGRRIMFGWVRTQLDPGWQGREWLGTISLPREVTIGARTVDLAPARELQQARGASRPVRVDESGTTRIDTGELACFELRVELTPATDLRAVTFEGPQERFVVPLSAFTRERDEPAALSVVFDCGIVEAFLAGEAGTWSNGAWEQVGRIVLEHAGPAPGAVIVWPLS